MDHLIERPALGAEVRLGRVGIVADGDGADRLVIGGNAEGGADLVDGLGHDTEVAGTEPFIDGGDWQDMRKPFLTLDRARSRVT